MPKPHQDVIPNDTAVTPIPRCWCGRWAFGIDLTIAQPVCLDHLVDWLSAITEEAYA